MRRALREKVGTGFFAAAMLHYFESEHGFRLQTPASEGDVVAKFCHIHAVAC